MDFKSLLTTKIVYDQKIIADFLDMDVSVIPVDGIGKSTIIGTVRHIPDKILPNGCKGIIINISANPTSKNGNYAKWGNDDNTYNKYPILFKILPRARSVCIINDNENLVKFNNQGYTKFLGATNNEEDEEMDIENDGLFTLEVNDKFKDKVINSRFVFTTKENGKMAVITMFRFKGVNYFFGGSKNEHMIVDEKYPKQVDLYRSCVATDIFNTWFIKWLSLTQDQKNKLQDLMFDFTFCGEYNDGRHMVPLKNKKEHIVFFGMIKKLLITDNEELCTDIVSTAETFSKLGCDTIEYKIINGTDEKEISNMRETTRYIICIEGYVIHKQVFTTRWHTISLEKYKTWWYVMIRMLRGFISSKYGLDTNWQTKWLYCIDQRNKKYMQFPSDYKDAWYNLTCKYIDWFITKKYTKETIGFMQQSLGMAETWKKFIEETGANDNIQVRGNKFNIQENQVQICNKLVLLLQGTIGLGKSCVGYCTVNMLNKLGMKTTALEQDTYIPKYGLKGSGNACFNEFKSLLKQFDIIILQRNNANYMQYSRYVDEAKENGFTVVFGFPSEIKDLKLLQLLGLTCMQSTMNRKGHIGLKDCPIDKQLQLVLTFISQLQVPNRGKKIDLVFEVDYLNRDKISDFQIDKQVLEWYQNYYDDVAKDVAKNVQKTKIRSFNDVSSTLKLCTRDYQELRLAIDTIATSIVDNILSIWNKTINQDKYESKINYIAVTFSDDIRNQLIHIIESQGLGEIYLGFPNKFLHHITLLYCMNNKYDNNLYRELLKMEDREIIFSITNIVVDNKLMVFECDLDVNNILVESKIPHLTIATDKSVKPIESINIIANKSQYKVYPVDKVFAGKITFIR